MSTRGFQDVPPVFYGNDDPGSDTSTASSGKPNVQSLGNGYSLVQWTVPTYDPVTGTYVDKPMSQIVPDKDAASVAAVEAARVAAGAAGTSARITTEGANQRAAVQAEIDRARNAADAAHQQALDALAQGNAAEARRQFAVTSQETQRAHDLDASIRQQEADLAKNKFGFDVYNKLSDLASNPRNYMEQFFRQRGSPPPANSAQYGNGGQQGIVPFEQFLPNFLHSTFGASSSSGQTGAAGVSSAPAAPASPRGGTPMGVDPGYDNAAEAAHTTYANSPENFSRITSAVRSGSLPQSALTNLPQPVNGQGVPEQNVGGTAISPSDFAVRKNLDLSSSTKQFADGGTLRMTAPHAIVNLLTGHVAAIAGEQPGAGPLGFVPETAKFDGQAIIKDQTDTASDTPNPGDPIQPQDPVPPVGGTSLDPGYTATTPTGYDTSAPPLPDYTPAAPGGPDTSAPSIPSYTAAPVHTSAPDVFQRASVAPAAPFATPITSTPALLPQATPVPNADPLLGQGGTPTVNQTPPPPAPYSPENPPTSGPLSGPNAGFGPPPPPNPAPSFSPNTPSLSFLDSLRSLSQTPSGLGKNPSFLPEDAAAQNPIVRSLMDNGAFAPFLQRLYAQDKGLAGLGTNVPQQTNLPAGVPLSSRLALSQMSPSELAAFQSFISANGIDWNDYLAMVDAASPQGGVSKLQNSLPKYLSQ